MHRIPFFFFFYSYCDHRDLHKRSHSFPTRRSSDLGARDHRDRLVLADHGLVHLVLHTEQEMQDRKSTRLNPVTNAYLVCRLLLEKKKVARCGKYIFHDINAHALEYLGDADFLIARHRRTGTLLTIAQSRIENH